MALKCISLPQMEGAGVGEGEEEEKERRASDRQGERGGRAQSAARPPFRPRPALSVRPALPPPPRTAPPQTPSAGARPSARAFVHIHPPKQASSPPGRAPRKKGGESSGPGAPDTHPADPAEGRVLLIHFPLALARPGRQGAGRGGEEKGAPLGRTIRDGEGTGRGAGARWAEGLPGGEGRGAGGRPPEGLTDGQTAPRLPRDSPTCRTLSTQPLSSSAMPRRKGSRVSSPPSADPAAPADGAPAPAAAAAAAAAAAEVATGEDEEPPPPAPPAPPPAPPGPLLSSPGPPAAPPPVLKDEYMQISRSLRGKDQ